MSIACVLRVVVAVVFNERVQQSKNYIMKTKSNELRATSESPTSDSTYTTVAKRASFGMESDFSNSSRSICGPSSGVSVFYRSSLLRDSVSRDYSEAASGATAFGSSSTTAAVAVAAVLFLFASNCFINFSSASFAGSYCEDGMMYLGSPFGGGMVHGVTKLHVTSAKAISGDERSIIIIDNDVVVATPRNAAFLKR